MSEHEDHFQQHILHSTERISSVLRTDLSAEEKRLYGKRRFDHVRFDWSVIRSSRFAMTRRRKTSAAGNPHEASHRPNQVDQLSFSFIVEL